MWNYFVCIYLKRNNEGMKIVSNFPKSSSNFTNIVQKYIVRVYF